MKSASDATVLILGDRNDRRCAGLVDAIQQLGGSALVEPWEAVIADRSRLRAVLSHCSHLHLESPGEHRQSWMALVRCGAAQGARAGEKKAPTLHELLSIVADRGRIAHGRWWWHGVRETLARVVELADETRVDWFGNRPEAIASCIDKVQTRRILTTAGVPMAPAPAHAHDLTPAEILALVERSSWTRLFVKPRYGSSASGILAMRWHPRRGPEATTTVELDGAGRLYNSLRIRTVTGSEIERLLSALAVDGLVVERWIPKLGLHDHAVDVRQVVHRDRATHAVARGARGPFCNLHLGNRRLPLEDLVARIGEESWARAQEVAVAAVQAMGCAYAGVDLLIDPAKRCRVAEVNAFGDLLPGILYDNLDAQAYAARHLLA